MARTRVLVGGKDDERDEATGRNPIKVLLSQFNYQYKKNSKPISYKVYQNKLKKIEELGKKGWKKSTSEANDELENYYNTHKIPTAQDKTHPSNAKEKPISRGGGKAARKRGDAPIKKLHLNNSEKVFNN